MEHSSTPGLIVGPFICSRKECLLSERCTLSLEWGRGGGGGGGKVLGIVSPEDTNGFWCRVFFTQHLTHGAVLLQSLHFNIHYDDVRRSNGPTIGHLHRPEGESIFKTLKRRPFSLHLHTISCLGNTCIPVCVTLFSCVCAESQCLNTFCVWPCTACKRTRHYCL